MKAFLALAALLGVGVCLPESLIPTLRFHARRQATVRLGDLIQEFALDVSDQLWLEPASVVFSPISITSVLSMLLMGSRGTTYHQLRTALYYPSNVDDVILHRSYQSVNQALSPSKKDSVVLNIASRLFLQQGTSIISNFTTAAKEHYGASVKLLRFQQNPQSAMNSINIWVRRETKGKIPKLLTQPFQRSTTFVAVNTVYFNGAWETPFNPQFTHDGIFNTGTANITVPMMRTTMTVPYIHIRELNADMIALPYKGRDFAMFLVVPNGPIDDKTLQEVEFELTPANLNRFIGEMINSTRSVALPRMKLDYKTYLKDTLRSLGVETMFDKVLADFSRLTMFNDVFVDDLIHQTVIEITETGTEAAAATSVSLNRIGTSNSFEVNRPALFFIRHMESGVPLFWGRVLEPDPLPASGR